MLDKKNERKTRLGCMMLHAIAGIGFCLCNLSCGDNAGFGKGL